MRTIRNLTILAILSLAAATPALKAQEAATLTPQQQKAMESARAALEPWVKLIDAGKYEEGYNQTAPYFREKIKLEGTGGWIEMMKALRQPLGEVVSRNLIGGDYKATIPGGPNVECAVFLCSTVFKNNSAMRETFTLMPVKGSWMVVGYFINPQQQPQQAPAAAAPAQ